LDGGGVVRVRVESDDGVAGVSETPFGRLRGAVKVLAALINEELAPEIVGEDPFMVRRIRDKLWRVTDYHGSTGLACFGIAAIDLALWDLMGKALQQPVWRLLGAHRDRIPAYAMVGWLNYDLDRLRSVCERAVAQGFRGVKIKVGAPTLEGDVRRIEAAKAAVGPHALVMVDANQVFGLSEALRRGRVYEKLGCSWFEEPLPADDVGGLAALAAELDIPIASGENNFGKHQFRELFARRAVDVVQPDLRRAGGGTECLDIAAMADAFGIPYASHGGGAHLHFLAAMPNCLFMESGLLPPDARFALVDGCYPLPREPGLSSLP
jgi:L-alanine-DL-glutamate epimerase-like enolase superfamily enzyme